MFTVSSWLYAIAIIVLDVMCFAFYKIQRSNIGNDESLNWISQFNIFALIINGFLMLAWFLSGQFGSLLLFIPAVLGYAFVLFLKVAQKQSR